MSEASDILPEPLEMISEASDMPSEPSETISEASDISSKRSEMVAEASETFYASCNPVAAQERRTFTQPDTTAPPK